MPSNFPVSQDTFAPNVDGTDVVFADDVNKLQDAMVAVQAKLGINSSGVSSSIDYKVSNVGSIDPGHHHTNTSLDNLAYTKLTYSSLTAGHALIASGASAASFRQIKESDIADENIMARLAQNENVTGQWTFFDNVIVSDSTLSILFNQGGGTHGMTLDVSHSGTGIYTFTWPLSYGTSGQFLRTDGAGNLSWVTSSGTGVTTHSALTNPGMSSGDDHPQYLLRQPVADVVINNSNGDFDFIVKSTADDNCFNLVSSVNAIGLGVVPTTSGAGKLQVAPLGSAIGVGVTATSTTGAFTASVTTGGLFSGSITGATGFGIDIIRNVSGASGTMLKLTETNATGTATLAQIIQNATGGNALRCDTAGVTGAFAVNATEVVVNNPGSPNMDFRVAGDTLSQLMFIDVSADNVGVNTALSTGRFNVSGSGKPAIYAFNATGGQDVVVIDAQAASWALRAQATSLSLGGSGAWITSIRNTTALIQKDLSGQSNLSQYSLGVQVLSAADTAHCVQLYQVGSGDFIEMFTPGGTPWKFSSAGYVEWANASAPSAPAAGKWRVYFTSSGMFLKSDTVTIGPIGAAVGLSATGTPVDNRIARWDGATALQNTGWTIGDDDGMSSPAVVTAGPFAPLNLSANFTPAADTASTVTGIVSTVQDGISNTFDFSNGTNGSIVGGRFTAQHNGTSASQAQRIIGVHGEVRKALAGPVVEAFAAYLKVYNQTATNTITTGVGLYVDAPDLTGGITNYHPIYVNGSAGVVSFGCGLQLRGSTIGKLNITVPGSVTDHTLVLPSNNAAGYLLNNGSGTLSWASSIVGAAALHSITAATTTNTIANGANTQTWQWTHNAANVVGLVLEATGQAVAAGQRLLLLDRNGNERVTGLSIMADSPTQYSNSPLLYVDIQSATAIASNPVFKVEASGTINSYLANVSAWDASDPHTPLGRSLMYVEAGAGSTGNSASNYTAITAIIEQTGADHRLYTGTMRAIYALARSLTMASGGAGAISNLVGVDAQVWPVDTYTAPITVAAALRAQLIGSNVASIITDGYGLLLLAPSDASTTYVKKWGIRQLGSEDNALGGSLTVGSTAAPAVSASIDLTSTSKGLLVNRVATTASVGTPVDGMLIYDNSASDFKGRKGGAWTTLGGAGGTPALHTITAATAANTIANTNKQQTWQWALANANEVGFKLEVTGQHASATGQQLMFLTRGSNKMVAPLVIRSSSYPTSGQPSGYLFDVEASVGSANKTGFWIDAYGTVNAQQDYGPMFDAISGGSVMNLTLLPASANASTGGTFRCLGVNFSPLGSATSFTGAMNAIEVVALSQVISGSITSLVGVDSSIQQVSLYNAAITTAACFRAHIDQFNSATITTAIGYEILAPNVFGTITNLYGILQRGTEGNALGGHLAVGQTALLSGVQFLTKAAASSTIAAILKGASSQSAALMEARSSADAVLSSIDASGDFHTRADKSTIVIDEWTTLPATPTNDNQARIFVKNNALVIMWASGGTPNYLYITLTGTGVTWTHSTTPP